MSAPTRDAAPSSTCPHGPHARETNEAVAAAACAAPSCPLRLSSLIRARPRDIAAAREAGVVCDFMECLRRDVAQTDVISALAYALLDVDFALEFSARGGQKLISRLLVDAARVDGAESLVDDLAAAVSLTNRVNVCTGADVPPPLLDLCFDSFYGAVPVHAAELAWSAHADDGDARAGDARAARNPARVLLRRVSAVEARQSSQQDVGFALWPLALPMTRWLVAHAAALRGARVLEVGAGCGLVGLAAALVGGARCVWLSDFNERVLTNLAYNVRVNEAGAQVARFDWSESDGSPPSADGAAASRLPAGAVYDVIIGSDVICSDADAKILASAVRARLARDGVGVFLFPPGDVRWGVDALADALTSASLVFTQSPLPEVFLCERFEDAALTPRSGDALADDATIASGYEARAKFWFVRHAR